MHRVMKIMLIGIVGMGVNTARADILIRLLGQTRLEIRGDSAEDVLEFSRDAETGDLRHNRFSAGDGGYVSDFDFDPVRSDEQRLSPDAALIVRFRLLENDQVVIDESLAPDAATYTFRPQLTTGPMGGALMIFDGAVALTLIGTAQGDVFEIDPEPNLALTLDGGDGDDTMVIGALSHVYSRITAALTVLGGNGSDTLILDDTAQDVTSASYQFTQAGISMPAPGGSSPPMNVELDEFELVSLRMADISNNVDFIATPGSAAGSTIEIVGGTLGNRLQVFSSATLGRSLENIRAAIVFDGGDAQNDVFISDRESQDAEHVTIRDDVIGAGENDTLFGPGGSIHVVSQASVSLSLGIGALDVNMTPSPRVGYFIDGDPTPGQEDSQPVARTMRVDIPIDENFTLRQVTGFGIVFGVIYDFDNHESISAAGFQRISPGGTVRGRVFADADGDGQQDEPAEAGLAGVPVELDVVGDEIEALRTTTDAQGTYIFTDLVPDHFLVRVVVPDGAIATRGDRADADVNGVFSPVIANFGLQLPRAEVADDAAANALVGQNGGATTVDAGVIDSSADDAAAKEAAAVQAGDEQNAADEEVARTPAAAPGGLCPVASLALMVVGVVGVVSTRRTRRR